MLDKALDTNEYIELLQAKLERLEEQTHEIVADLEAIIVKLDDRFVAIQDLKRIRLKAKGHHGLHKPGLRG